ncbi:hypothetical protein AB0M97_26685 [Streptomyces sp. NPDC051207]|uniref:hypothetical protein n=1 Tax=Streptomyces sp. NPDC051207 TaxID=3154641 RepID=UPI0034498014
MRLALADAEELHRRRVIGSVQYLEALAEEEPPADVVDEVSRKKPVGPRRAVPHRRHATGVKELSPDYQALTAAAADAGGDGLGARRAAVVLGWDTRLYGKATAQAWDRLHSRLTRRGAWLDHDGPSFGSGTISVLR